jgi:hypothetical protein
VSAARARPIAIATARMARTVDLRPKSKVKRSGSSGHRRRTLPAGEPRRS